ncbi:MAG: OmcA/MtrC family decaheme c-type cytochrome [Bryobacteraceae bacterium]
MSSSDRPFTPRDKAYYLEPSQQSFIRPGLVTKILSAQIAQDGTITARFRITDPRGLPLQREGITTPGAVSTTFIAAYLPRQENPAGPATQYVAYTTRVETDAAGGRRATQATADTGGAYQQVGDGEYIYTFGNKAANFDPAATHSIGVWSTRNLAEFDLGSQYSDDVFTFVPNGSPVTQMHEEVRTETCNKCHDPLNAHGGSRQRVALCVLCHTPQSSDAQSGNTVDFPVMIHRIHMGEELPSVQLGRPYQLVGFNNSVNDYSAVVFPAESPSNCRFCHDSSAAQADAWLSRPSRKACGACHDNVNFQTGEGHSPASLPQLNDNQCNQCHIPQGENEFDASIVGAHTLPRFSSQLPGVVLGFQSVGNVAAGQRPTITFTLRDKAGKAINPTDMNLLNVTVAYPATDYSTYFQESLRNATGTNGVYTYALQNAIPAGTQGTVAFGLEGYRNVVLDPNTVIAQTVRDVAPNQVTYAALGGTRVAPRRLVVSTDECNQCHFQLQAHGTIRNRTEYCVLCHNPNANDASQRPAGAGPPETIHFANMIHKIHRGEEIQSDYTIYGFGGRPINFNEVLFPGDLRDCAKCHLDATYTLPLPQGLLPVTDPNGPLNPMGPAAAACLGCHTSLDAAAHAQLNTSPSLGESCAVCHGANADFSVERVHAR